MPLPGPTLKRFEAIIFKDKGVGDPRQVPASGSVVFYRQGATVKDAQLSVSSIPQWVNVYNTGQLAVDDEVWVNGSSSQLLLVDAVDPIHGKVLLEAISTTVTLAEGQRLLVGSRPPDVYSVSVRDLSKKITGPVSIDSSTGRVWAYVAEFRFDYFVSVTGEGAPRVFLDAVGSFVMRT